MAGRVVSFLLQILLFVVVLILLSFLFGPPDKQMGKSMSQRHRLSEDPQRSLRGVPNLVTSIVAATVPKKADNDHSEAEVPPSEEVKPVFDYGSDEEKKEPTKQIAPEEDWQLWVVNNLDNSSDGSLNDNVEELIARAPTAPGLRARQPFNGARLSRNLRFLRVPNQDVCRKRRPFVVVVHSAVQNFGKRKAIRSTWARMQFMPADMFRLVFVVGTKIEDVSIRERWQKEADRYRDFLQYDSPDTYDGITVKVVAWMRFLEACRPSPIVLKLDDDVMMAPWRFVTQMRELLRTHKFNESTVMCYVFHSNQLVRDAASKWYIPSTAIRVVTYPPYCNGPVVVMPTSRLGEYYRLIMRLPYIHVDDALFTGFLREHLGMQLLNMGDMWDMTNVNNSVSRILAGKQAFATMNPPQFYTVWPALDELYANQSALFLRSDGAQSLDGNI